MASTGMKRCSTVSLEKLKLKQQWDVIMHLLVGHKFKKSDNTGCWP